MAEKIDFIEDCEEGDNLLGYFLAHVDPKALKKLTGKDEWEPSDMEVGMTLNGMELPVKETMKQIEEQMDRCIKEKAEKLLETILNEKLSTFLDEADIYTEQLGEIYKKMIRNHEPVWHEEPEDEKLCRNCFNFRKACCPTPGLCYCNGWKQSEPQGTITLAEDCMWGIDTPGRECNEKGKHTLMNENDKWLLCDEHLIEGAKILEAVITNPLKRSLKESMAIGKELPKQIVMIWQCGHCGAIYRTQAEADECHEEYAEKSWLMSDGTIWDDSCFNFDQETMVTNDSIQGKDEGD